MGDGTKTLVLRIADCHDCPFIGRQIVKGANGLRGWEEHEKCNKTGRDLFTACKEIPIPQDCPIPEPVDMQIVKKGRK